MWGLWRWQGRAHVQDPEPTGLQCGMLVQKLLPASGYRELASHTPSLAQHRPRGKAQVILSVVWVYLSSPRPEWVAYRVCPRSAFLPS